jgi:hypothetical protein
MVMGWLSQIYVLHGECKGQTDQVPKMCLIGETGLRLCLCPMHAVMETIRYCTRGHMRRQPWRIGMHLWKPYDIPEPV